MQRGWGWGWEGGKKVSGGEGWGERRCKEDERGLGMFEKVAKSIVDEREEEHCKIEYYCM